MATVMAGEQYRGEWDTPLHGRSLEMLSARAMTRIKSGPWDEAGIMGFLEHARIPIRLSTNGSSGPLVQSLWFAPHGMELWCCTQKSSLLTRRLERDDRVGFEVAADAPPYRGVRGTGVAHLIDDNVELTLRTLIERYQGSERTDLSEWLLSRIDSEIAVKIEPRTLSSWDFSHRMATPRSGDQ